MQVTSSTKTHRRGVRLLPSVAIPHPHQMQLEHIVLPDGYLRMRRWLELLAILLTAPFILGLCSAIAVAISIDSRGGIFYHQVRVGKNGRRFVMHRFRSTTASMIDEVELPTSAERGAPTTRIGGFLRLYRLDELPQLWNVIRGDMSLIGPRPELPHISINYDIRIPNYRHRRILSPGITGWAQLHPDSTIGLEGGRRRLDYDLYYITKVSPGIDLLVVLKTIPAVLLHRGRGES